MNNQIVSLLITKRLYRMVDVLVENESQSYFTPEQLRFEN